MCCPPSEKHFSVQCLKLILSSVNMITLLSETMHVLGIDSVKLFLFWSITSWSEHRKCAVLDISVAMLRCPVVNAAAAAWFLFYMSQWMKTLNFSFVPQSFMFSFLINVSLVHGTVHYLAKESASFFIIYLTMLSVSQTDSIKW